MYLHCMSKDDLGGNLIETCLPVKYLVALVHADVDQSLINSVSTACGHYNPNTGTTFDYKCQA